MFIDSTGRKYWKFRPILPGDLAWLKAVEEFSPPGRALTSDIRCAPDDPLDFISVVLGADGQNLLLQSDNLVAVQAIGWAAYFHSVCYVRRRGKTWEFAPSPCELCEKRIFLRPELIARVCLCCGNSCNHPAYTANRLCVLCRRPEPSEALPVTLKEFANRVFLDDHQPVLL